MKATYIHRLIPLVSLAMGCSLAIMPPIFAQPEAVQQNLSELRPLQGKNSILSMAGAATLMDEAIAAISDKNYDLAVERLQDARVVYNNLSNSHLRLANNFQGIDNKIYDTERKAAIAAGDMRDTATYRLALVHRVQEQPELTVPLLIQVIESQSPVSDLGKKSYQQLFEIGFVSNAWQAATAQPNPDEPRPLQGKNSILTMAGASALMDEAIAAIAAKNYNLAVERLQNAREAYNNQSNSHLKLANSFQGIDDKVYDAQRQAAIAAGDMRDTATYRLALVHRVQGQAELAVPLLIQVIESQSPASDLGKKSYQQLLELGFVSSEFVRPEA